MCPKPCHIKCQCKNYWMFSIVFTAFAIDMTETVHTLAQVTVVCSIDHGWYNFFLLLNLQKHEDKKNAGKKQRKFHLLRIISFSSWSKHAWIDEARSILKYGTFNRFKYHLDYSVEFHSLNWNRIWINQSNHELTN